VVNKGLKFGADNNKANPTTQQLGSALTVESGDVNDTTNNVAYKGDNLATFYENTNGNGKIVIGLSEKPVFKEVTAKDGDKVSKLSPTNITTTDGTSTTTIAPDSITVGDKAGDTDKPVTITSGQNGGTISNLDGNLDGAKSGTTAPTTSATKPTLTESNAATVGDVLNAGWNLKENNTAKDFVTAYDTVDFVNGNGTTVNITSTNGVSKVKVDVNTTALSNTSTVGGTADGKIYAPAGDEGKLVNATTVANAINQAAWNTLAKASGTGKVDGTATSAAINAGDKVNFVAGNNLVIKQENNQAGTETDFTYSLASDLKGINSISNNAANGDNVTTITLSNDPADKKVTLNDAKLTGVKDGEIADNSSDAINGSQLKDLADKTGLTVNNAKDGFDTPTFTNLKNVDGSNIQAPTTIKGAIDNTIEVVNKGLKFGADNNKANPTTQQLGSALTVESGDVTDTTNNVAYKGDNLATFYDNTNGNGKIVIGLSEKPVFKEVTAKDGNNVSKLSPTNITTTDGTSTTTIAPDSITVGDKAGNTDKPVTITSGQNGGAISNLDGNLNGAKSGTTAPTTEASKPNPNNLANNNAATVGDVLNAGWNLQGNGVAKDFVRAYDTVNFINGDGTTVEVETAADGKSSTIKVNTAMRYTDSAGNPLVKNDADGKFYPPTTDGKPDTTKTGVDAGDVQISTINPDGSSTTATKLGNVAQGAGTLDGTVDAKGQPLVKVGDQYYTPDQFVNGKLKNDAQPTTPAGTANAAYKGLADLNSANPTNVMTVADAKNLGWVVSASGNGYADDVRNANQVDFKGTGLATVKGETNATTGIRTITVDVNAQNTVESAQTPVVYTDANGNKVTKADDGNFYPADSVVIDGKRYPKGSVKQTDGSIVDANGQAVAELQPIAKGDIIASMNNGDNATAPTALSNVGSNLTPTTSGDTLINQDGTTTTGQTPNKEAKAPTAEEAKKMNNNAATVGDVLNAGWNLQGNGSAVDFVKPYDTVNFVDGVGTLVKASSDGATSVIQVDVDKGSINVNTTTGAVTPTNLTALDKAIADATKALDDAKAANPTDPNAQAIKDAEAALAQAEANKAKVLNKVATVEDVANAISNSGFTLTSSAVDSGKKVSGVDELINPGEIVEMIAGKNMTVKQDAKGKITYATADDVSFNSVTIGSDVVYKDKDGNELVKGQDGKFYNKVEYDAAPKDADGNPILTGLTEKAVDNAKSEAPVKLAQDKGVATKETTLKDDGTTETKTKDAPSALSVKDSLGENSQINGIASALDTKEVKTNNPRATTPAGRSTLVDLTNAPNDAAVTTGDLKNLGWVVSVDDNGYTDTVKNANEVKFFGKDGITVEGKTNGNTREITIALEKGEVVKSNEWIVTQADGTQVEAIKIGNDYYAKGDIDPETGEPKAGTNPITVKNDANGQPLVENKGAGYVNGNQVADAIQKSGFVVGKQADTSAITFDNQDEKVNPNDNLKFADGKGTVASLGTIQQLDSEGNVVTTTVVKFDIDSGSITPQTDGSVKGPSSKTADEIKGLNKDLADAQKALADAQKALADLPATASEAEKAAAAQAVKTAQNNVKAAETAINDAGLNKVATAQDVANAINESGWNVIAEANGGVVSGSNKELVKPSETVSLKAGKNIEIAQEGQNFTFRTSANPEFNTVTVGSDVVYKDKDGNELVKGQDGKFYNKAEYDAAPKDTDGNPILTDLTEKAVDNAKSEAPVKLAQDKGVATKETTLKDDGTTETKTKDAPSALSVKDSLGENSQINGIASALDTKDVATKPNGTASKDTLVDLTAPTDPDAKAKWSSSAVTVGDIANMGWVVSASENGYTDTVKNANKVDFKGENGISVTGKTTADGVREITVSLEKGEVIKSNEGTVKVGDDIVDVIKITNPDGSTSYYRKENIDPTTGKPKENSTALAKDVVGENGENVVNNGSKFVDGNTVAQAIQEAGFVVGKQEDTSGITFNNQDEKVNPDDNLRFADGKGTNVSLGTVKQIDPNGTVSTNTVVKVDVDTGTISSNEDGSVNGVVSVAKAKELTAAISDAAAKLATAEKVLNGLPTDAPQNVIDAAKAAVYDAEKAKLKAEKEADEAGLNKVATVQNVSEVINNSGWNAKVAKTGSGEADDKGGDALVNPGDTVTMTAGDNMKITKEGLNYTIETKKDVTFDSVTANSVNIGPVTLTGSTVTNPDGSATNELSVGTADAPTRITNVAPGVKDTDAVNVSQLKGVQNNINQRFGDVYQKMDREHKNLRAGIAGAAALAGIPEVHVAGRSMIAASASAYKSENAIAVGYSRLSDNSKIKLKLTGSANTRGDVMGTVGVGYMW
ncbi:YadA-like family protein, partial [Actinobacillus porcinus]|uniref:YadA-like family protein n=1 Tax=Actinobacillus porcinus TaxID=51048 RepID=UPI002353C985